MSKTDTPNDHRPLVDSELDAVNGGFWNLRGLFAPPPPAPPAPNVTVNGGPLSFVAKSAHIPECGPVIATVNEHRCRSGRVVFRPRYSRPTHRP